jgi:hypothetical protein
MMGFPPESIGYLYYLAQKGCGVGDISQMDIRGANPDNLRRIFKPHSRFEDQKQWHDERVTRYLGI